MPWPSHCSRAVALLLATVGASYTACVGEVPSPLTDALELEIGTSTLDGSFVYGGTLLELNAARITEDHASVHLEVGDVILDVELDRTAQVVREDGHFGAIYAPEHAVILVLRDLLALEHPEILDRLDGQLLLAILDRYAEVPLGLTLDRHEASLAPDAVRDIADGCGDDGVTCLPGTGGVSYAVYDPAGGACVWTQTSFGDASCAGRCGAGCNPLDNDYTWDCLDHDRCIDAYGGTVLAGNANCGDEFWDAADDYVATLAPLCFGGSMRQPPATPPPAACGNGVQDSGEVCDDGNRVSLDGCSDACTLDAETFATKQRAFELHADDDYLYWLTDDDGAAWRRLRAGGDIEAVVAPQGQGNVCSLAIDDAYLYWSVRSSATSGQIFRKRKDLTGEAQVIASGLPMCRTLLVDETQAYWRVAGGNILRVAKDGGTVETYVTSGPGNALALAATQIYWDVYNGTTGQLHRRDKSGGSINTVFNGARVLYIATTATAVYFTTLSAVMRLTSGGLQTVHTLEYAIIATNGTTAFWNDRHRIYVEHGTSFRGLAFGYADITSIPVLVDDEVYWADQLVIRRTYRAP